MNASARNGIAAALMLVCISLGLTGCESSDDFAQLSAQLQEIRNKPKGHIDPPPKFQTYENFIYGATLFRSPFQRPVIEEEPEVVEKNISKVQPDLNRPKEVLEDFSLESLTMVGTIQKEDEHLFALIKDNKAGIHRVKPGNYMGRNHGKIKSITPVRIELVELIPDGQEGWLQRPRTVNLRGD